MKRILMYDCNTVDTVYAPLVCREIMMQDDLIDRLACGYVSKTSKEELQKQGFRMVGAEERGNRASCAFITELVACAFDRQIEGIDIVTNDDTILAAVVKAQEQGKDIRVLGSDAHSEAFIRRCNRFCYIDILQGYEPERCLTPLSESRIRCRRSFSFAFCFSDLFITMFLFDTYCFINFIGNKM